MWIQSQWRRLRSKPVSELVARAVGVWELRAERKAFAANTLAPGDRLARALGDRWKGDADLLAARRARRAGFFPSLADRERVRAAVSTRYGDELLLARSWAERALAHDYHFFGRSYRVAREIPWHVDPVTGASWPRIFYADIPTAGGDVGFGDVKDVWELSRHQFLVDLGKVYFLEGTSSCAAEVRAVIRSWIAANPYATGINWASPLEPAYRSLAWLWAYHFTLDDPALTEDDHSAWMEGFLDHGRFLHRHLELYASPFNHLIGEATALYALGALFPELDEAAAWQQRGRDVLEQRLPHQFYGDGGSVEQATLYHHATLGFYLIAALIGRANGDELSGDVWKAIERGIEFSMRLVQPDGQLPAIGDTDDARPIQLERKPFFDFRAFQSIGAVLFERGDFKAIAGRFHEDALWLLGPDALDRFDRLPAAPPDRPSVALDQSGYFVLRSDWSGTADYVCFDCGEQAGGLRMDDVASAAHGHADCLSVVVFLGGRPVLVDSGFYTYNGNAAWERALRETAAHNTARVDSRDQAKHLAKMAWIEVPRARVEHWADLGDQGYVAGSHDGFVRASGITHRRYVWYRPGGYVVIFDDFEGPAGHDLEVSFHFAAVDASVRGESVLAGDAARLTWSASFPVNSTLKTGGTGPDEGWIAPSLGIRVAAPCLRLHGRMQDATAGLLTVVAPPRFTVMPSALVSGGLALSVDGDGWHDELAARPTSSPAAATSSDAPLAVWRHVDGIVVERRRIGGTFQADDLRPGGSSRTSAGAGIAGVRS